MVLVCLYTEIMYVFHRIQQFSPHLQYHGIRLCIHLASTKGDSHVLLTKMDGFCLCNGIVMELCFIQPGNKINELHGLVLPIAVKQIIFLLIKFVHFTVYSSGPFIIKGRL